MFGRQFDSAHLHERKKGSAAAEPFFVPTRPSLHTTHFHPPSGAARHTSERTTMQQNAIDTNLPAFRFCSLEHANLRAGQHANLRANQYSRPTAAAPMKPQSGPTRPSLHTTHFHPPSGAARHTSERTTMQHRAYIASYPALRFRYQH